jgi:hypothetical protein
MTTNQLLTSLGTALASFLGAWLAARFALSRFYREKVWERKTGAYTTIFEALHDMGIWFDKHLDAEVRGIELDEQAQDRLSEEYRGAKQRLERQLASETWLIPDCCQQRLAQLIRELDAKQEYWFDVVETGSVAISSAEKDLRQLVREDLGLQSPLANLLRWAKPPSP